MVASAVTEFAGGRFAEARTMGHTYLAQAAGTDHPDALALSDESQRVHHAAVGRLWRRFSVERSGLDWHHLELGGT